MKDFSIFSSGLQTSSVEQNNLCNLDREYNGQHLCVIVIFIPMVQNMFHDLCNLDRLSICCLKICFSFSSGLKSVILAEHYGQYMRKLSLTLDQTV